MPHSPLPAVLRWLLASVLAVTTLALVPTGAQAVEYADWGRTAADNQRYRKGCHGYHYRYRINPPSSDWHLETRLLNPNGRKIAADLFHFDSDPRRGRATFRVCGASTRPGRHTIRAKVTFDANDREDRLRPSRFRLTRR